MLDLDSPLLNVTQLISIRCCRLPGSFRILHHRRLSFESNANLINALSVTSSKSSITPLLHFSNDAHSTRLKRSQMEPSISPKQQPTGARPRRGRADNPCQLDAWPGPRCLFGSVFSSTCHPWNHCFVAIIIYLYFLLPLAYLFFLFSQLTALWNDKGHKYAENNHVLGDNDEAWMAAQRVQGHTGQDIQEYLAHTFPPSSTWC